MSKRNIIDVAAKLIEAIYGPKARKVFLYLVEKGTFVPEENIGKELGFKSNEARKLLQALAEEGFISFRRTSSRERGQHGWYVNYDNLEGVVIARLKRVLEKLKIRLEYENRKDLFYCPQEGIRYTIEEAMAYDFICPRCGALLEEYDGSKAAEILRKRISEIEETLRSLGAL